MGTTYGSVTAISFWNMYYMRGKKHCQKFATCYLTERSEEEAPKFIQTLSPVEVTEGDPLILSCSLTGKPEPNVEWFFNGQVRVCMHVSIQADLWAPYSIIIAADSSRYFTEVYGLIFAWALVMWTFMGTSVNFDFWNHNKHSQV